MIRPLLLLAGLFAFTWGAAGAATSQSLELVLHHDAADAHALARYDATVPISLLVHGEDANVDAVTVTANGPDGTAIRAVLARTTDGFQGAMRLMTPGTWNLALQTHLGSVTGDVANLAVQVVSPVDGTLGEAGLGFSLASILAGIVLLVAPRLRRRTAPVRIRN